MSRIEWTDVTWNPTVGCSVISPGCTNCYAMRMAARLSSMGIAKYDGLTRRSGRGHKWNGVVRLDIESLKIPYSWSRPRRVFVNSMSDLFHENLRDSEIERVWRVMEELPQHEFQILTKRSDRLADVTRKLPLLKNVWLGVSVENKYELARIDDLRRSQSAIRFISFEPLLEDLGDLNLRDIDWCIVGGESGPGARPIQANWVRNILFAAREHNVAFHFKQWGGPQKKRNGRLLDGKTYDEFPT